MKTSLLWTTPFLAFLLSLPITSSSDEAPEPGELFQPQNQERKLKGRFIHITDFHPDPFYAKGRKEKDGCHILAEDEVWDSKDRWWEDEDEGEDEEDATESFFGLGNMGVGPLKKKKRKKKGGHWGLPNGDCDAPMSLINATFDWLKEHWRDEVDFVVWTGDNARHDLDSTHPRTLPEIFDLNKMIVNKMLDAFGNRAEGETETTLVPSIGNNDIWPHNIMFRGPTEVTSNFAKIWQPFIPEHMFHTFHRGGYYWTEVIPNELAVFSINTLYFYDSNKVVDGCPSISSSVEELDPGTEELDWLHAQLKLVRSRGMQAYLTGHVPPTMGNWYAGCYERYGELALSFQDIILGHFYGHMNVDHFFLIDTHELPLSAELVNSSSSSRWPSSIPTVFDTSDLEISRFRKNDGFSMERLDEDDLKHDYKNLPKKKKTDLDDYAIVNVAPSVVPTYLPAIRVFTYNITRGENDKAVYRPKAHSESSFSSPRDTFARENEELEVLEEGDEDEDDDDRVEEANHGGFQFNYNPPLTPTKRKHRHDHTKPGKGKKGKGGLPRYANKKSPSRRNRYLTPLGYTQFFIDLEKANKRNGWGPKPKGLGRKSWTEESELFNSVSEKGAAARWATENDSTNNNGTRPPPEWQVEYTTFTSEALADSLAGSPSGGPTPWPESITRAMVLEETRYKQERVPISEGFSLSDHSLEDVETKRNSFWTQLAAIITSDAASSSSPPKTPSSLSTSSLLPTWDRRRQAILDLFRWSGVEDGDQLGPNKKGKGRTGKKKKKHFKLDMTPYGMKDLSIKQWVKLARKLAKGGKKWDGYVHRMFVFSGEEF